MWDALYRLVARIAIWPVVGLLFTFFLICIDLFNRRSRVLSEVLDTGLFNTPAKANKILEAMGERGRSIYALTELSLDLVFPFVYGGLFAILLFRLYREYGGWWKWVVLIPLCALVADLLENFTAAYLACSFDGRPCPVAWATMIFTSVKVLLFMLSMLLIFGGAVRALYRTGLNASG